MSGGQENYQRISITLRWLIVGAVTTPDLKRQAKVMVSGTGKEKQLCGEGCPTEALVEANSQLKATAQEGANKYPAFTFLPPSNLLQVTPTDLTQPESRVSSIKPLAVRPLRHRAGGRQVKTGEDWRWKSGYPAQGVSVSQAWKLQTSLPLTFPWLEPSYVATFNYR